MVKVTGLEEVQLRGLHIGSAKFRVRGVAGSRGRYMTRARYELYQFTPVRNRGYIGRGTGGARLLYMLVCSLYEFLLDWPPQTKN